MKKFLVLMLILLMSVPVYSWDKDSPDIETLYVDECFTALVDNQGDLDRLVTGYRRGAKVSIVSTTQYSTAAGELVLNNSAGTAKVFVRNTSAITTTPTLGASTTYYVYAIATSIDATTFTIETSTNATTPSGTYFRRLATFTTNSSSLILSIKNYDSLHSLEQATGTISIASTGNVSATGLGFKPSAIIFIGGQKTVGWNSCLFIGIMTSNRQFSAQGNSDNANFNNGTHLAAILGRGGNGSLPIFMFDYVSMDADGFTINVSDADSNTNVMWIALA